MADKEERILITKCSSHCHALRVSCDPFDDKDGMYCDKSGKWVKITEKDCAKCKDPVLYGISRQEAIERIAKAIYTFEIIACSHDECGNKQCENCETWKWCKNIAEAALNALLENKK